MRWENLLVPLMDALLIPVPQSRFDLALVVELVKQEPKLLAECVQALPPGAAAVLVLVADEDFVQQRHDVCEHGLVVRRCIGERFRADLGCGSHAWEGADSHCEAVGGRYILVC